jgi:choline dehydrogenase
MEPPAAQVLLRAPDGKHGAESWDLTLGPWLGPQHAGITVMQAIPNAAGSVRQNGSWVGLPPIIEHQFAGVGSEDLDNLSSGVELAISLGMARHCAALAEPDAGLLDARSAGRLVEWIKPRIVGNHHPVGTCSLVDLNLRVYGVDNLYVVDASIFPSIPRANVHLTVLGVAERAAAILIGAESQHA